MSDNDTTRTEDAEVKSFHLAPKEHSFHLVDEASKDQEGAEEEVKSFHLADNDRSFRKV